MSNQLLTRSFKGCYPFRLGTTSFIIPADYATNAKRLGPYLDEIELLLFEGNSNSLPSAKEITKLIRLAQEYHITYNVHLPIDINPAGISVTDRQHAADTLVMAMERAKPLGPITHTLHLPFHESDQRQNTVAAWQQRAIETIQQVLQISKIEPRRIAIENLEYPPQWLTIVVESLDAAICMDTGHLLCHGFDLQAFIDRFRERIQIIHLHGVSANCDHRPIDHIDTETWKIIAAFLMHFKGSVSLEVFGLQDLMDCLDSLPTLLPQQFNTQVPGS